MKNDIRNLRVGIFREGHNLFWLFNGKRFTNREAAFWVHYLDTLDLPLEDGDYIAADFC